MLEKRLESNYELGEPVYHPVYGAGEIRVIKESKTGDEVTDVKFRVNFLGEDDLTYVDGTELRTFDPVGDVDG